MLNCCSKKFVPVCGLLGQLHEHSDIVDTGNNHQAPQFPNDYYTAASFPREYYFTLTSSIAYPKSDSSTESSESPATSVHSFLYNWTH